MNLAFILYLLLFLPVLFFFIWISRERVLKDEPTYIEYALAIFVLLVIWEEIAIFLRHWSHPISATIGLYLGKHSIEILISAVIFPLFIISVWEFVKRRR